MNFTYSDDIYHSGVLGMKWGVRRYQNEDGTWTEEGLARRRKQEFKADKKAAAKLKRRIAAENRNVKDVAVLEKRSRLDYEAANKEYEKALRSRRGLFGLRAAEKAERIDNAQRELDSASDRYLEVRERYERVKNRMISDSQKYADQVDKMIEKYSEKKIKPVKVKNVKVGENFIQGWLNSESGDSWNQARLKYKNQRDVIPMVKTGITVADLPVVGRWYSGRVGAEIDNEERMREFDEAAKYNTSYNRYVKSDKRRR